jgi:hypothetical protein
MLARLALLLLALSPPAAGQDEGRPERPRLVVLVCVDQLRAEYLQRFEPLFGEGGFRRLLDKGAVFPDAAHDHTITNTAPGHTALATGVRPVAAGIANNEWIERSTGERVYCVADRSATQIPYSAERAAAGASAAHLERPTLGDVLQEELGSQSIVLSVSWKDRSALLMGGRSSDGSYWMDPVRGRWVTSSALRAELPEWLAEVNGREPVRSLARKRWERALSEEALAELCGPDEAPGEQSPYGLGSSFPHLLLPVAGEDLSVLSAQVAFTPWCDRSILDVVFSALTFEPLGRDETTDLLCIGFSGLDYAGHAWGPSSQEVAEVVVALDRRLAELMSLLDLKVGPGAWALALSADHGVSEIPEQVGGVRTDTGELRSLVEAALRERFGPPPGPAWVVGLIPPSLYLDETGIRQAELDPGSVAEAAAEALARHPAIDGAYTLAQLDASDDETLAALARDAHPERSGQVLALTAANAVLTRDAAASHGTHHDYDRRVPVILYGAGIVPGVHPGRGAPLDVAPTLARLLKLQGLREAEGQPLSGVLLGEDR